MKARRSQDIDAQSKVRSDSARFLWHFQSRPKFTPQFSHEHWWAGSEEKVPLEAAIWELMRRLPDSEDAHRETCDPKLKVIPDPVSAIIGCHCFKTWCELSKWQQRTFVRTIRKQLPSRHGFLAPPVTVMNDHRPFRKRQQLLEKLRDGARLAAQSKWLTQRLKSSAVEYHRDGQILIAIDPAAPIPRITKGVESAVKHWREAQEPKDKGKARVGQWLDVVAEFEAAELARPKAERRKDQLFARYRRVIQDWTWRS